MGKRVEINTEVELEIIGYVTRAFKGTYYDPPTPSEVEDLCVGVIIQGVTIDITHLLNADQKSHYEQRCFETLQEQEQEAIDRKAEDEYDRRKEDRSRTRR